MFKLKDGETIVAVVPEHCSGPGWQNSVVWVYVQTRTGRIVIHALQPDEQSDEIRLLFDVGAVVCQKLKHAVEKIVR